MPSLIDAYPLSEAYQDRVRPEEQEHLRRATPLRADTGALGRLDVLSDIEMSEIGAFRAGQSAYNTGTGWYWEVDPTAGPRFSVGNSNAGQPKVLWDGADLTIVGDITASGGDIGGWSVGASTLVGGDVALDSTGIIEVGSGNDIAKLSSVDATYRFWVGDADPASAPFAITKAGVLNAVSGVVGGWTLSSTHIEGTDVTLNPNGNITVGSSNNVARLSSSDASYRLWVGHATAASAPFRVTQAGLMTATNANVTGTVSSTSGEIGGWSISSSTLTGGDVELDSSGVITVGSSNNVAIMSSVDSTYRLWVGHATAGSAPFRVNQSGALTATSGTIGGWTINGTSGIQLGSSGSTRGLSTGTWAFFAGSSSPSIAPFRVSTSGQLVASNINVQGGSITADAIDTGTLNGSLLGSDSVGNSAIASGAVDTLQIADAAITNAKVADLSASKITTGTLSSTVITLGSGGRIEDADGSTWDQDGITLKGTGDYLRFEDNSSQVAEIINVTNGIQLRVPGGDGGIVTIQDATVGLVLAGNGINTISMDFESDRILIDGPNFTNGPHYFDEDGRFVSSGNIFPGNQENDYITHDGTDIGFGNLRTAASAGSLKYYIYMTINGETAKIPVYNT